MHEMGYCVRLVNMALETAKANDISKVKSVSVEIGQMTGVLPHLLKECYLKATKDTVLEGSELNMTEVPVTALCEECNKEYNPDASNNYSCPICHGLKSRIIGGRDVSLINIVGE